MEVFTIRQLTFSYPGSPGNALHDVTLTIKQGEFITICGKSGCGKSTLLRHLKTDLTPHGARSGEILFEGMPLEHLDRRIQVAQIGYVLQSPDNQIVTDKVWHELAFGLESLGYSTLEIRRRVAEMASFFGIQEWFHKSVTELSGGQKQLLNLASIMTMQPKILILDEPTSQLDPIAAAEFLAAIGKINRELGVTILISEHRLEEVLPLSDRAIVMDHGEILISGTPKEVGEQLRDMQHDMFYAMPSPMRVYARIENQLPCPLTVREGREFLHVLAQNQPFTKDIRTADIPVRRAEPAIELNEVWFKYEKNSPDVVKGLSLRACPGEIYAIVGGNGTGKTTTLSLISGLRKHYRGTVLMNGKPIDKYSDSEKFNGLLGVLPQNPQALFVQKTVKADLLEMLSGSKLDMAYRQQCVDEVSELCMLQELLDRHPYDLSGGEQQRAALAKILLLQPSILLLDEPTKGLDAHYKLIFAEILTNLKQQGTTIVMVSHDIEFCASFADRCAMFFDGAIVSEGNPQEFFAGNSFYTTSASRMARDLIPKAITTNDIIKAFNGKEEMQNVDTKPKVNIPPSFRKHSNSSTVSAPNEQTPVEHRSLSKRTLTAMLMILLLIPLTIWFGIYYLDDRKYYFISMLIILETLLPFMMIFEGRKPQARELVVISVLCAIGVTGRMAFFMVPQFKPVVAIVILSGIALGAETGFLVGAVTGFVSNYFFGQGPWTPWQMFAFGIIGFLAGALFKKGILRRNRIALCLFGGSATFLIYGIIMNFSSVVMTGSKPTIGALILACIRGVPFDLIHAIATVIFLYFLARPMLEKLDRIKEKYGLVS
ncbi:ATP-binding cassette domain-containing protein [Paenibacillus sp. LMG 31461]|uniref:ATP-binding cassette domain-containing protein n=1 Tax=Paenibacillus plantarum TaxID=2654975 RepID=A0ABX1XGL5_9BACL|nr:energy-coupling factor transporter ATPase [Paenibacillus plantarum]NOU67608.1 ATP-binding cassette domain-containing protein [Paenibacillus plantarum]